LGVLAVDVGGTKLAAGIVDESGTVFGGASVPTPRSDDPEAVFTAISSVIGQVLEPGAPSPTVCGVGCGGPMDDGGGMVAPLNIPGLRDFPLKARLESLVRLPTAVDNDAKALALGEGWLGAAAGCTDYLAMVVSTGIGGGIVLDGRLLDGHVAILGNSLESTSSILHLQNGKFGRNYSTTYYAGIFNTGGSKSLQ
jgi:glucokinase